MGFSKLYRFVLWNLYILSVCLYFDWFLFLLGGNNIFLSARQDKFPFSIFWYQHDRDICLWSPSQLFLFLLPILLYRILINRLQMCHLCALVLSSEMAETNDRIRICIHYHNMQQSASLQATYQGSDSETVSVSMDQWVS